jgi:hypothetical protein
MLPFKCFRCGRITDQAPALIRGRRRALRPRLWADVGGRAAGVAPEAGRRPGQSFA